MTVLASQPLSLEVSPSVLALGGWRDFHLKAAAAHTGALREVRLTRAGRRPIGFVGAVVAAMRTAQNLQQPGGQAAPCGHAATMYLTATGGLVARLSAWADPARLGLRNPPRDSETGAVLTECWDDAALIGTTGDLIGLIGRHDASTCLPAPVFWAASGAADTGSAGADVAPTGEADDPCAVQEAAMRAEVEAWELYAAASRRFEDDFDLLVARFFGQEFAPTRARGVEG